MLAWQPETCALPLAPPGPDSEESGGLDPWTAGPGQLKKALLQNEVVPVPVRDAWRVHFLQRLLEERLQHFYTGDKLQEKRVRGLIDSLVAN